MATPRQGVSRRLDQNISWKSQWNFANSHFKRYRCRGEFKFELDCWLSEKIITKQINLAYALRIKSCDFFIRLFSLPGLYFVNFPIQFLYFYYIEYKIWCIHDQKTHVFSCLSRGRRRGNNTLCFLFFSFSKVKLMMIQA